MDYKHFAVFLILFWAALWLGTTIIGALGASLPSDPLAVSAVGVLVPGTLLYFLWFKWGKKAAD